MLENGSLEQEADETSGLHTQNCIVESLIVQHCVFEGPTLLSFSPWMCGICALSATNPVLMLCMRFLSLELAICLFKCLSIGKRFGFGGLKKAKTHGLVISLHRSAPLSNYHKQQLVSTSEENRYK